jgi:hypothetical protein
VRAAPVVVLGYPQGGAGTLQRLLSSYETLACTTGTGVLPLCEAAAAAWRHVENGDGPLSSLAVASIRAMTTGLITAALAGTGKMRWCETAFAPPRCAEIFLRAHPSTRFICLHRSCLDVVQAAVRANPWGLAGSPFEPFAISYPGNAVAAIAACWAASTEPLLEFEQAHPDTCLRVRYEDLTGQPDRARAEIASFLSLEEDDPATRYPMAADPHSAPAEDHADGEAQIPLGRIPQPVTTLVSQLMDRLGYPPILSPPAQYQPVASS